jgi:hypothetical protein
VRRRLKRGGRRGSVRLRTSFCLGEILWNANETIFGSIDFDEQSNKTSDWVCQGKSSIRCDGSAPLYIYLNRKFCRAPLCDGIELSSEQGFCSSRSPRDWYLGVLLCLRLISISRAAHYCKVSLTVHNWIGRTVAWVMRMYRKFLPGNLPRAVTLTTTHIHEDVWH